MQAALSPPPPMSGAAPTPIDGGSGGGVVEAQQADEALALVRGMGFGEAAAAAALQASGADEHAIGLLLGHDSGGGGGDTPGDLDPVALQQLVARGFEAGACQRALEAYDGDVGAAAEALLGGGGGGSSGRRDMSVLPGPDAVDALEPEPERQPQLLGQAAADTATYDCEPRFESAHRRAVGRVPGESASSVCRQERYGTTGPRCKPQTHKPQRRITHESGKEAYYGAETVKTMQADRRRCCEELQLVDAIGTFRGGSRGPEELLYLSGFLADARIRVWVPANYPSEPPIVDGFVLKSSPSAKLLDVCKALQAEIMAELALDTQVGQQLVQKSFSDGIVADLVLPDQEDAFLALFTAAITAKENLDSSQKQLRDSRASVRDTRVVCERDARRDEFICAVEAVSGALAGSAFAARIEALTKVVKEPHDAVQHELPPALIELEKLRRVEMQLRQLAKEATFMRRMIESKTTDKCLATLETLRGESRRLRQRLQRKQHKVKELELQTSFPSGGNGVVLSWQESGGGNGVVATPRPEQQLERDALLAKPVESWVEAEVQTWISLIGLSTETQTLVLEAFVERKVDGEVLELWTEKFKGDGSVTKLASLLKNPSVPDPAGLAESVMQLNIAAQGDVPRKAKLDAERAEITMVREDIRSNSKEIQKVVVHLTQLAQDHYPEHLGHEDVQKFLKSNGLQRLDRQLDDYEDQRLIVSHPHQVLRAKFEGVDVALKKFPLHGDMDGYIKELLHVQQLRHRNIIRYSAVFQDQGSMYIEMEYCPHGSLTRWIEATRPTEEQRQSILRQVLLALASMHEQGILHCDLKGTNILIAADQTARICDFGLSKNLSDSLPVSTANCGTVGFMAPEILSGQSKASAASDMYSFGILALNTLRAPVPGQPYPLTDTADLPQNVLEWMVPLINHEPSRRPTAVQLQDFPYFEMDHLVQRRFQDAADKRVREAERAAEERVQQVDKRVREAERAAEERAIEMAQLQLAEAQRRVAAATQAAESAARAQEQAEQAGAADKQQAAAAAQAAADAQRAAVVAEEKAQTEARKARQAAERAKRELAGIPNYWKNQNLDSDPNRFPSRFPVARIQDAMRRSSTEPLGHPNSLANCRVRRVERVENMTLWQNYQRQKQAIREKLKRHHPLQLAGRPRLPLLSTCDRTIDQTLNEFWLWHGTSPDVADILAVGGFDERVANTNGLYGAGSYFADASSKSQQYAQTDTNGHYCMLYCRVVMGSPHMTNRRHSGERRPPDNPAFAQSGIPHDSIMAEGGVAHGGRQINNEYVVFHPGQAYPEYIVWYTK